MTYDYIIVGGGLSGLYHAYIFNKNHPKKKIHIFQDSSRLGGRIYTHQLQNGVKVDMGAGRIATHHEKTMNLINELGLTKDLVPSSTVPLSLDTLQHFESEEEALLFLIKTAKTAIHKIPKKHLTSMSFQKVIRFFFSKKIDKIQEAIYVTGYDTEFEFGNAWIMCNTILDMYDPNLKYATINGGIGRITDNLIEKLSKKKSIVFHTDTCVIGWKKEETKVWQVYYKNLKNKTDEDYQVASTKHLHIATPLNAWESWLKNGTIQNVPIAIDAIIPHIQKISLCRVYATYENTEWISAIHKCVTHTKLRYIIPIDKTTIMISYLDGEKADELSLMTDDELKEWVLEGTKQAFPGLSRFIPEPTEIKRGYWKVGVHLWSPMNNMQPPSYIQSQDDTFSLSGEAFSKFHQGWIEGALQTHTVNNKN